MRGGQRAADPLSEAALRRALRLEADELPRRLDPAAVIAAARADRPRVTLATASSGILVALAVVAAAGAAAEIDPSPVVGRAFDAGVGLAVWAGVPLWQVASTLAGPTPALVSLAAVVFAVMYERAHGGERGYVPAS